MLPVGNGLRRGHGNHWLVSGLPFLGFMVAGSLGISVLLQGRNDVRDAKSDVTDLRTPARKQVIKRRNKNFNLEEENERTLESLGGIDTYELVPVPRPWEEAASGSPRWLKGVKRWFGY